MKVGLYVAGMMYVCTVGYPAYAVITFLSIVSVEWLNEDCDELIRSSIILHYHDSKP